MDTWTFKNIAVGQKIQPANCISGEVLRDALVFEKIEPRDFKPGQMVNVVYYRRGRRYYGRFNDDDVVVLCPAYANPQ